ncbi:MAG: helix-turn-helix domain-containing protein [Clostridiales bacterium]|nr:helix-turn-helix domain-containing protein [Clostridiales bacterium]
MEILSTGQKIKRARIYKGITLKELCKDKISISKMSCIENGKIEADEETIKYIADVIEVDYEYLAKDVYDQIKGYTKEIEESKEHIDNYEKKANDIISYAMDYEYYDLALELMHNLFSYHIENEKYDENEKLISKYYSIYEKSINDKSTITYFMDIGIYLFNKEEYAEAYIYFSKILDLNVVNIDKNIKTYLMIKYRQAECLYKSSKYDLAEKCLEEIILIEKMEFKNIDGAKVYNLFSLVLIRQCKIDGEKFKEKAIELTKDTKDLLARMHLEYGKAYYYVGNNTEAINEIKESIKLYPKDNDVEYAKFINEAIEILIEKGEIDIALENIEDSLNIAISTNNIKLIERAYYLKACTLQKQDKFQQSEMYMNLSIDALFKFGSKKERYKRYIDMANLYYKIGNINDAIKYFNIALAID